MDLSKAQIEKLVKGCAGNERQAQETLYRAFYARMLRICSRYSKDKAVAQEALNDGFLKVFRNIKDYDIQRADLGAWICTIMIRTAIDHSRREMKFSAEPFDDQDADDYFVSASVLQKLYAEDLLKYMRQLPDATRVIFNLSVIDGYSHKEIGEQLSITESTSRWHLSEAKKKLRVLLQAGDTTGKEDNKAT
jgi:RNA polymerase sigma-70 factor (ECF subfamily)